MPFTTVREAWASYREKVLVVDTEEDELQAEALFYTGAAAMAGILNQIMVGPGADVAVGRAVQDAITEPQTHLSTMIARMPRSPRWKK